MTGNMTDRSDDPEAIVTGPPPRERSVLQRMAFGAVWMVAARWSVRCIGLVSTVILARLLRPEDFGLVAMGALIVGFVLVFGDAGQSLAVVRHANATREHFDTAWTISIIVGIVVAIILEAIAPLGGWYFHEPRAVAIIQFLALKPVINGFTNVGIIAFRKELRFGSDFSFLVARKFSVFVATIVLALILRNYWALAIGNVGGEVLNVVISYRMHPYRPRLCLTKLSELWSFSGWMQLVNIGYFFGEQTDQFVVGGLAGASQMGGYNVASDIASAPTNELVYPPLRALFPIFATLLHDPAALAESYLSVFSIIAVVALATGIGVALVADDMVAVVLGTKWLHIAPLVPWLAVTGALLGVERSVNTVLVVTGNVRLAAYRTLGYVVLLAPAVVLGGINWGPQGIAIARTAVTFVFLPVMFYALMVVLPISAGQIVARLWRPAAAALCMSAAVGFSGTAAIEVIALRLLCNVGLGAAVFTAVLLALWRVCGRPAGAESLFVHNAGYVWRRFITRRSLRGS
jgi:O-antigen/teichoic acid export membrane protein